MVWVTPFSVAFWICYLCGGLSDLFDGFVARKLKQESAAGAKLDSIADLIFSGSIFIVAVTYIDLPNWLWWCAAFTALLRIGSYCMGFCKYHTFSALHTNMNKAAGAFVFASPLLYILAGFNAAAIIVCLAALVSSVEEMAITVISKELDRDCKGIFMK